MLRGMPESKAWLLVVALLAAPHAGAEGTGGCDAFTRDLSREFELLHAPAQLIGANENIKQAGPALLPDRHYTLVLLPQERIGFVVPPAREARDPDPQGGIFYFHADTAGRHRIAIDTGHWVDVIDSGSNVLDPAVAHVLPSVAHESQDGCKELHKVVAFDLEAGKTYRLHFSGRSAPRVNVVISRE